MNNAPEWRQIRSFPSYEVSDQGDVRRAVAKGPSRAGRLLRGTVYGDRRRVKLRDAAGKPVMALVHRLVAEAFIGECPAGPRSSATPLCCHDDGDGLNNRPSNLFYRTQKENMADRERHGRTPRGERNGEAKLTASQVVALRSRYASTGVRFKDLAAEFGITTTQVGAIVYGESWRHVGGPICVRPVGRSSNRWGRRPVIADEARP